MSIFLAFIAHVNKGYVQVTGIGHFSNLLHDFVRMFQILVLRSRVVPVRSAA